MIDSIDKPTIIRLMLTTPTHIYFFGGVAIYSNWFPAPFEDPITHVKFANSEQAFFWYKAHFFGDLTARAKIAAEPNPAAAKKLGREVRGFNKTSWDLVKVPFMTYVNYLKYTQDAALWQELLDTGDRVLVEASPFDEIWGIGLGVHDPLTLNEANWRGENLLGKALMQVRDLLHEDIRNGTTWQPVRMP